MTFYHNIYILAVRGIKWYKFHFVVAWRIKSTTLALQWLFFTMGGGREDTGHEMLSLLILYGYVEGEE